MTERLRNEAYSVYEKHNNDGLRVLAVAQKNEIHDTQTFGVQDETNMVLIGFVGFLDPPKASSKQAISALKKHGVDTVVLTGDSEGVALNVCKKVGIQVKNHLTGKDIDGMTDEELKEKAKKWNTSGIKKFMFTFGTISTLLDIMCFLVLWFIFKFNTIEKSMLFQTAWFAFGIISQTLIIHLIRTHKMPFIKSKSSKQLLISTFTIVIITILITFTNIATIFDLNKLPYAYMIWIIGLLCIYALIIQIYKKIHLKRNREWL